MTPLELDKRDFKKAVRGYSEDEVDNFLARVRADYEALYVENQELKTQLDDYEQNVGKYKALEQTLNNTLIVAQQTAEDLKHNAEKAAELILEEAKLKAQQKLHEAEAEIRKLALQKEELLKRIQELKIRLRAFLRAQLDLLEKSVEDNSLSADELKKEDVTKSEEVKSESSKNDIVKDKITNPAENKTYLGSEPKIINTKWVRGEQSEEKDTSKEITASTTEEK